MHDVILCMGFPAHTRQLASGLKCLELFSENICVVYMIIIAVPSLVLRAIAEIQFRLNM